MDLAWLSLTALAVVIVASCVSRANPGVVAIGLAWIVALVPDNTPQHAFIGVKALLEGFNGDLLLTLIGVSLLFAQAEANGTLVRVAQAAQALCRGRRGLIPVMFFLLAFGLGSAGPGNIAMAGLLAPVAMAAAARAGISPLLMAVAVGHGAIASTLSPFTVAGAAASKIMGTMGLEQHEWQVFGWNAAANGLAALVGYLVFGGWRLFRRSGSAGASPSQAEAEHSAPLETRHWLTIGVIGCLVLAVIVGKAHIGLAAFAGAAFLSIGGLADEREALAKIPWSVIVMVCGVSLLTSLLDKTGGSRRFAEIISHIATPGNVTGILALVTGLVSIYSSTTGVVLPAFLPLVKELTVAMPGSDPLALSLAVLVGGNLVDMSPLSTIGALCLAAAPADVDRRVLFRQLLIYGFVLAFVGAGLSWVWFG